MFSSMSVRLSDCQHDYTKSFQAIFMKPCRVMDYCYGKKNQLNVGVDPLSNGRPAVILDFCYNILHIDHMQSTHIKAPPSECQ